MRWTLTCLTIVALLASAGCAPGPGRITAWVADDLAEVVADTPPVSESSVYSATRQQLTLTSALNETIAFQLVLRA